MIEGVEVEVEAEEVAEDVGVGQNNYEEPGPRGSAADFLLGEEMEGDPSGREELEAAAINKPHIHPNTIRSSQEQHRCSHNLWCICYHQYCSSSSMPAFLEDYLHAHFSGCGTLF